MKTVIQKKGLSPVIATILLIFLVLTIASIIFLWARGFFSEQLEKNGESIENQCNRVDLGVDLPEGYGGGSQTGGLVTVDFVNDGDINLYGVNVRGAQGGSAESDFYFLNLDPGSATRLEIEIQTTGDLDELSFYPVLLGSVVGDSTNKEFTCVQNAVSFSL